MPPLCSPRLRRVARGGISGGVANNAIAEHDQAFAAAKQAALDLYSGASYGFLILEQDRLRDLYAEKGPRHSIVAGLEVIQGLLAS